MARCGCGRKGASIESSTVGEKKHDESARDADKKASEIDWDRYIENHAMQAPMPGGVYRGTGDELPSLEATLSKSEDLVDHVEWQIRMSDLVEDERAVEAAYVGLVGRTWSRRTHRHVPPPASMFGR